MTTRPIDILKAADLARWHLETALAELTSALRAHFMEHTAQKQLENARDHATGAVQALELLAGKRIEP